jgi:hypothetical protein
MTGGLLAVITTLMLLFGSSQEDRDSCPQIMLDYHHHMGGVGKFDQLRFQRYSVQLAFRFQKYYKTWVSQCALCDVLLTTACTAGLFLASSTVP